MCHHAHLELCLHTENQSKAWLELWAVVGSLSVPPKGPTLLVSAFGHVATFCFVLVL